MLDSSKNKFISSKKHDTYYSMPECRIPSGIRECNAWNACPLPALPADCRCPACLPCLPACPAWNLESRMPAIIRLSCHVCATASAAPAQRCSSAGKTVRNLTFDSWILLLLYSNVLQARSKRKFILVKL